MRGAAIDAAVGLDPSALDIGVARDGGAGSSVMVTVAYSATVTIPLVRWLFPGDIRFAAKATMRQEPRLRWNMGMAYDAAHGRVVLFGGTRARTVGDTWTWNGRDWRQRTPAQSPPLRHGMGMTYDAARGQVVMFGGGNGEGDLGDTWTWNGTNWRER